MPVGMRLKALRTRRSISVREVERASARIAAAAGDVRFRISNGWLVQLEKGTSEPGICKLFSLSVIYQVRFLELVRLYDVDVDESEQFEPIATPQHTRLFSSIKTKIDFSTLGPPFTDSSLLDGSCFESGAAGMVHGYIGSTDFTMYPLIRPGSLVQIDTHRNKLTTAKFRSEYERPIYFVELRGAYVCGWCELQGRELLVVPHPASQASVRRFAYPKDAEIVGQVVAFHTRWIDES
jgi:transcriptional regulator with XRE-family HTH domain